MEVATAVNKMNTSSYRVKFDKQNFLELIRIARPRIICSRKNMHFFAYDGFVMYTDQCNNNDFSQIIQSLTQSSFQTIDGQNNH